jgi:hypothetical protein
MPDEQTQGNDNLQDQIDADTEFPWQEFDPEDAPLRGLVDRFIADTNAEAANRPNPLKPANRQ